MIRVVADTNIALSAFLFGGLPYHFLNEVERSRIVILTSETLISELEESLNKSKFIPILVDRQTSSTIIISQYRELVEIVPSPQIIESDVRDPDDNIILACAVTGQADYIVTGDKDLLVLQEYQHIKIVRVADFMKTLSTNEL